VTLLAPIGLVTLLVPLTIYLVHWLSGSRRRLRVSAVFLWSDLPQASMGRARRRWPPITLLLVLQLLAASLVALTLARPGTPTDPPRHLALIVDASASMQSTDVTPTRFDAARARGLERLAALGPADRVSLIRAGRDATLLASGTPDAARDALNSARPSGSTSAIRESLALASSQIAATPDLHGQIVLLSDVAWPTPDSIGSLAAPVEVVAVGGGSNNQAVSILHVRMDPNGRAQTAFVEIVNHADRSVRVPIRLTADGAPLDERQVDIPARTRSRLSIPLPVDAHHITVRLLGHDLLALDDVAETNAPGGPPRDVAVLGRVSDGLRRALESVPSLHVRARDASVLGPADLTVLAGSLPPRLPAGPLLLVDPPSSSGRLLGVGLGSGARVQELHPLLQGLDLAAMQSETPSVSSVPGWAHVVLGTLEGPLIMEGRLDGQPVVALTFDPSLSGLEKSLAFPLLISNATSFLLNQPSVPPEAIAEPFDPSKSDIAPRPIPTFAAQRTTPPSTAGIGERWQWLLIGALAVLGLEWLVFARRG
jgi:Ca-activated chloride channel family protein